MSPLNEPQEIDTQEVAMSIHSNVSLQSPKSSYNMSEPSSKSSYAPFLKRPRNILYEQISCSFAYGDKTPDVYNDAPWWFNLLLRQLGLYTVAVLRPSFKAPMKMLNMNEFGIFVIIEEFPVLIMRSRENVVDCFAPIPSENDDRLAEILMHAANSGRNFADSNVTIERFSHQKVSNIKEAWMFIGCLTYCILNSINIMSIKFNFESLHELIPEQEVCSDLNMVENFKSVLYFIFYNFISYFRYAKIQAELQGSHLVNNLS